jgi:hypothetical protein
VILGGTSFGLLDVAFRNRARARQKRLHERLNKIAGGTWNKDSTTSLMCAMSEFALSARSQTSSSTAISCAFPSPVFADYAIDHLKRLVGTKMLVDFNEAAVIKYQNDRLDEGTAPKTINEEVGFLLRILGEPGDIIRARWRKRKMLKLKVRKTIGKAYSDEEKERMLQEARKARSPHIYFALTKVVRVTRPLWISRDTSRSRCSNTTAIFAWKRSGPRSNPSCARTAMQRVPRRPSRMTHRCPEIRSILKGSPYSAMILGVIGE